MGDGEERTVAHALPSDDELLRPGPSLKRVFQLPTDTSFDELLIRLDRAAVENDRQR